MKFLRFRFLIVFMFLSVSTIIGCEQIGGEQIKDEDQVMIRHTQFPDETSSVEVSGPVQSYTITFAQEMDRNTVEEALKRSIWLPDVPVEYTFDWKANKKLELNVQFELTALNAYIHEPIAKTSYTIDLNQTEMKSGEKLHNIPMFETLVVNADEESAVIISLLSTPEIQSPVKTINSVLNQHYKLVFTEEMNKESVEQTITKHLGTEATLVFKWENEKELHVTVDSEDDEYNIDVTGATTAEGVLLQASPPFYVQIADMQTKITRLSLDGTEIQQFDFEDGITSFYSVLNDRYVAASRMKNFNVYDSFTHLHFMYDVNTGEKTHYPIEEDQSQVALLHYSGAGSFYADRRGFFYSKPTESNALNTDSAIVLNVDGYVHEAIFSLDKQHIIMAVGTSESTLHDLQLVIYDAADGNEVMRKKDSFNVGSNEIDMVMYPVSMRDQGEFVYITLKDEAMNDVHYMYDWSEDSITPMTFPIPYDDHIDFSASSDGNYTLYQADFSEWQLFEANEAGETLLTAFSSYRNAPPLWIEGTSQFVYMMETEQGLAMKVFDAQNKEESILDNYFFEKSNYNSFAFILSANEQYAYVVETVSEK
ncbi:hypothetical protein [Longirhabdus pacifica]|uniref:hypothetical protein n=1 Tax=Longirhabdus pacifica TaxID=2305227 RepID=UPI001008A902|nr:hypothetical protein [Longirhabdus pacifica]